METRIHSIVFAGVISGICISFASCASFRTTADFRAFPAKPDYTLDGQYDSRSMSGVVDTNCIYLFAREYSPGTTHHNWYRFWNDGRVIHRSAVLDRLPSPDDANSFYGSSHGYYIVTNGNVYCEMFAVGSALEGGGYQVTELVPVEGGFRVPRFFIRSLFHRNDEIWMGTGNRYHNQRFYRRVPMEGLVSAPDW